MHPPCEDSGRGSHQQQREIEAFRRVEAEERDVHPERARDDGDRQGDREDDREDLDDLVGLVRHEGRLDFHQATGDFSIRIEGVQDADHVVLDVPQVVAHLLAEEGDFEAAQDPEDVPLRPQVIPQADHVGPHVVEMRDARPTRSNDDENGVVVHFHLRMEVLILGVLQGERVESEERLEFVERPFVRIHDVHPGDGVFLDEFPTPADRGVWLLEEIGRRIGDDLDADHAPRTSQSPLNPCARRRCGNSKWPPFLAHDGGRMKVMHRKDATAFEGDKSLSYQVISPDNVGSRKFLVTVVDIRPGGSTPVHEHRTVESMYYILEGRGEVTSGRERKVVRPGTAVYFPAGSTHGIRNVGKTRLRYLSCHAPPYEIEDLYRSWQAHENLGVTGGVRAPSAAGARVPVHWDPIGM